MRDAQNIPSFHSYLTESAHAAPRIPEPASSSPMHNVGLGGGFICSYPQFRSICIPIMGILQSCRRTLVPRHGRNICCVKSGIINDVNALP